MSKLFKLKKWLSLEVASTRLSTTLEEDVKVKDLIQLILDGELNVSWYFQENNGIEAVEVIKDNVYVLDSNKGEEFSSTHSPLKYITNAQANIPNDELFRVFIDNNIHWNEAGIYPDYRVTSQAFFIEGVHNIHVNTGDMKTYFEEILFETKSEFESQFFTGIIVEDENGKLYKLVNPYIDEFSKHEDRISPWAQTPYPLLHQPKISDLVILRSDLEKFEHRFTDIDIEQPQTPIISSQIDFSDQITQTKAWQDLYQLTEQAISKFEHWRETQSKPTSIPKSHIDDWLMTSFKATKRESETIKKILIEIYNL
jgi:hypothetical protein